uniref:Uncharacterized protein n=1 Tax=viral metagenome TaxID=1070528 RepID=A0A6C0K0Y2_9ZZZZ
MDQRVKFSPLAKTFSGKDYYQDDFIEERKNHKEIYGNNTMLLNPELGPTTVHWHTSDSDELNNPDYEWPSQQKEYFQSSKEHRLAKKAAKSENKEHYTSGKWKITDVDDNGNATLCNLKTGVCIAIAIAGIAAAKASGLFGGKTRCKKSRCKKTQCKKTRRNRKNNYK